MAVVKIFEINCGLTKRVISGTRNQLSGGGASLEELEWFVFCCYYWSCSAGDAVCLCQDKSRQIFVLSVPFLGLAAFSVAIYHFYDFFRLGSTFLSGSRTFELTPWIIELKTLSPWQPFLLNQPAMDKASGTTFCGNRAQLLAPRIFSVQFANKRKLDSIEGGGVPLFAGSFFLHVAVFVCHLRTHTLQGCLFHISA